MSFDIVCDLLRFLVGRSRNYVARPILYIHYNKEVVML